MSAETWALAVYLLVAAIICIGQWIENATTYFMRGPPSGLAWGLTWPLWLPLVLLVVLVGNIRTALKGADNAAKS